ncbi:unnamed protein product [Effrenium voratum]|nr:unnamed protein product [Effrenium voratum]
MFRGLLVVQLSESCTLPLTLSFLTQQTNASCQKSAWLYFVCCSPVGWKRKATTNEDRHLSLEKCRCWVSRQKPPPLDFYIYSSFTENPSNQCLIHAYDDCVQCLNACEDAYAGPGRNQRYCCMEPEPWIPSAGLFPPAADGKACIPSGMAAKICGTKGYGDVYEHFKDKTVGELWAAVKTAATSLDPKAKTLFDAMLL